MRWSYWPCWLRLSESSYDTGAGRVTPPGAERPRLLRVCLRRSSSSRTVPSERRTSRSRALQGSRPVATKVLPVFWRDNGITLWPGGSETLTRRTAASASTGTAGREYRAAGTSRRGGPREADGRGVPSSRARSRLPVPGEHGVWRRLGRADVERVPWVAGGAVIEQRVAR
ncbi:MAG: hypothetical protein ACLP01_02050 [Solirubrobacteraceae bacterium]